MKKLLLAAALLVASSAFASDVIKSGAAISPDAKAVPLADVLAKPVNKDQLGRVLSAYAPDTNSIP